MDTQVVSESEVNKRMLKDIKRTLLDMLFRCKLFIQDTVKENYDSPMHEVLEYQDDAQELEDYLGNYTEDDYQYKMVKAMQAGEDISMNNSFVMDSANDADFDSDDLKDIGTNNGILKMLQRLFKDMGMHEEAKEAGIWIYNDDYPEIS